MDDAKTLESRVDLVTLFEDRAEVSRSARVRLPKGRARLRVQGLTLLVDDRSLVAWVEGEAARVVSARVHRAGGAQSDGNPRSSHTRTVQKTCAPPGTATPS